MGRTGLAWHCLAKAVGLGLLTNHRWKGEAAIEEGKELIWESSWILHLHLMLDRMGLDRKNDCIYSVCLHRDALFLWNTQHVMPPKSTWHLEACWAGLTLLLPHQMDTSVCVGRSPGTQRQQTEKIYFSSDLPPFAAAVPCFPPSCSGKEGKRKLNAQKDLILWQNKFLWILQKNYPFSPLQTCLPGRNSEEVIGLVVFF